jgi:hypothetical protein
MRRIGILQGARLASKRVPQKLLLDVGGQRLIDRGLRRLLDVQAATGAIPFLVLWEGDQPLWHAARSLGVDVVPISSDAIEAEAWGDCFAGLAERLAARFDWLVDANFLCRPFLKAATAASIVRHAATATRPFVCTHRQRGLLWDGDGRLLLGHGQTANTKTNPVYHDLAHLAYGLPTELLGREAEVAALVEPFAVELSFAERVDIDTPDDVAFANVVCKYLEGTPA